MSIKYRTSKEIEQAELSKEALKRILLCADEFYDQNPFAQAGDRFKCDRKFKGECFQRIIKEAHKEYNGKCKIPEVRFLIFEDGRCVANILDGKKKNMVDEGVF